MRRRGVEDLLRRVEPQPVQVELVDPVAGVGDEELADRTGVGSVEVDGVAPFVLVAVGEVVVRERAQVVPDRAEVVVDDVEDHGDAAAVCHVDEPAEVVGRAVEMRRRVQIDAVVSPAETPFELGDRHHLDDREARVRELAQLGGRGGKRAGTRERADVHLVDHLTFERHAGPRLIGPAERAGIDDLRRAVHAFRLEARRRIRISPLVVVEQQGIAIAERRADDAAEVPAGLGVERHGLTAVAKAMAVRRSLARRRKAVPYGRRVGNGNANTFCARRPHAHVREFAIDRLDADRQSAAVGCDRSARDCRGGGRVRHPTATIAGLVPRELSRGPACRRE